MTQRQTVLRLLQRAGREGLCVEDVDQDISYCLRNRVSELRDRGYTITVERCRRHSHYGHVARYRLVSATAEDFHGGPPVAPAATPVAAGVVARAVGVDAPAPAAQTPELFPEPFERARTHGR